MSNTFSFDLSDTERLAILNSLNYFGFGCSAGECSTLTGMDQQDVQALFDKLKRLTPTMRQTDTQPPA